MIGSGGGASLTSAMMLMKEEIDSYSELLEIAMKRGIVIERACCSM